VVLSGGIANATNVSSGGVQQVDAGGLASATVISSGGFDAVFGSDSATIISSGGQENVASGGTASGATVNRGAAILVSGGVAVGVTLDGAGVVESRSRLRCDHQFGWPGSNLIRRDRERRHG
jgi:autotransporter passenger strand-loop-strand repeat protein